MIKIELKNVNCDRLEREVEIEVVEFDRYNDDHVDFAYNYSDMMSRAPSAYKDITEAARDYVRIFMAKTGEDIDNKSSIYNYVYNDKRACRTVFNTKEVQEGILNFFLNA